MRRHSREPKDRWRRRGRTSQRDDLQSLEDQPPSNGEVPGREPNGVAAGAGGAATQRPAETGPEDDGLPPPGPRPYLLRHQYSAPPPEVTEYNFGLDSQALRESGRMIESRLEDVAVQFYATLFANFPDLRNLFPASMEGQRSRLVGALVRVMTMASDSRQLVSYLSGLGRDHRKFGVISQHYGPVGMALITALRQVGADQWTPRYDQAWIRAYDAIAKVMVDAADRDARWNPPWWDAEVVMHRRVFDDLAIIQVRPHTDYPYRPGQYCYLMTPRRDLLWRPYSLATAPREDGLLEFHIRAVGAGWVSSALVWRTEVGDILRLGAPQGGDITDPRASRDLLCISGGTGIAPVLAGVQDLALRQDGPRVHVFYAGRDRDSLYALPHLESIGMQYRRLTIVPVVSPEETVDRSPDVMGNIVAAYGDWHEHDVFVSGPTTMVSATVDQLRSRVPEPQIRWDDFGIW